MKKNVAGQIISAVVVSATDGSAITSGISVTVTGDGGTQGAGGGTTAHEGGGEWSYAPTQAETNFDHIMFKFSGTGAIPVGVQVYTTFPQTGDGFARLGAPAGASVSADVAAVKAETAAILVDTGTTLDGKIDAIDTVVDAILADTDDIGVAGAGLTAIPWNAAWDAEVQSEAADALAAYDPPTAAELTAEIDAVQADIAALNDPTVGEIADAVWDEAKVGHVAAGSMGEEIQTHALTSDVDALNDLDAAGVRAAVGLAAANLDTQLAAIDDFVDTEVASILSVLGPPAGATLAADIAAVKAETVAILEDTGTTLDAKINAIDDFVDTEVASILSVLGPPAGATIAADIAAVKGDSAAVKTKTDQLIFTKANELDANIQSINGATVTGDGNATPWDGF